jgi:hypothetical protein
MDRNGPRCGRAMQHREASGEPPDLFPACGRLAGHAPPCISARAMARKAARKRRQRELRLPVPKWREAE